jgi:predicted nucleotidyltransferase
MDTASTLTSDHIIEILDQHSVALHKLGAVRIGVFGSRRRGEAGPDSDIDLLVTLARPSFNDYMDIKLYLEELFGRPVDLVLEDSLRPELKPRILHEVRYASRI